MQMARAKHLKKKKRKISGIAGVLDREIVTVGIIRRRFQANGGKNKIKYNLDLPPDEPRSLLSPP
jgi:hypothetical protein